MKSDPDLAPVREMPEWEDLRKSKPEAEKAANAAQMPAMHGRNHAATAGR